MIDFILDKGLTVVGLAGLVAFVIFQSGYETFYSKFGVRPEEVGVSYVSAVTRGGYVFGMLAIAAGGLSFTYLQLFPLLLRVRRAAAAAGRMRILLTWSPLALPLAGPLVLIVGSPSSGRVALGTTLSFIYLAYLVVKTHRVSIRLAIVAWCVAELGVLAVYAQKYAHETSDAVAQGHAVEGTELSTVLSSVLLPWPPLEFVVTRTCVTWAAGTQPGPLDLSKPLMYLGESDQVGVFYAPSSKRTVRIAIPSLVLASAPTEKKGCP